MKDLNRGLQEIGRGSPPFSGELREGRSYNDKRYSEETFREAENHKIIVSWAQKERIAQ